MACMSANRANAELLSVVTDLAARFFATISVCANQLSMHPLFWPSVPVNLAATNSTNFASVWRGAN
jgi:hypothetical protein